jgi:hypothetical protein
MSAADYNAAQLAAGKLTATHVTVLVRAWQAAHPELKLDGAAGPATIASIEAVLRPAPFLSSPLPVLADGRTAVVTSSFRPPDRPDHNGVDLFYPWNPGDVPDFVGDHGAAPHDRRQAEVGRPVRHARDRGRGRRGPAGWQQLDGLPRVD